MEMANKTSTQGAAGKRARRVLAILLSLVAPGAGHFLLGTFGRGVAWAIGLTVLVLSAFFLMPVSLAPFVVCALIVSIGRVAAAIDTARLDPKTVSWKMIVIAWGAFIVASVLFSLLVYEPLRAYYRAHYVAAFVIPSGGMEPTLLAGDYILTDNSIYRSRNPQREDIIVFKHPQDDRRDVIKRIIALPGEQILVRGRQVYVNGKPLPESYVNADSLMRADLASCNYAYGYESTVVPPDSYFVLGDSRDNSRDSRYWGFVKREKVIGRAFAIYWSSDGAGSIASGDGCE
jgi:signal peptidase I